MAQEGKLKRVITDLKEEALKLQLEAFKENVEASSVAKSYLTAIEEIDRICKERNRY